ncbi:Retrovirus-related Pol polyprotein from transposon RE2 [Bienertia sinuspersici]
MCCLISLAKTDWIIDSGATDDMSHDLACFDDYTNIEHLNNYITIPDGSKVLVKSKGTIKIGLNIVLKDVLYAPEFRFNLISVPKLCKDMNVYTYFSGDGCYIQDPSQTTYQQLGRFKNGLYFLDDSHLFSQHTKKGRNMSDNTISCSAAYEEKLWHLRMGHMPFQLLNKIQPSLDVKTSLDTCFCQVCPMARQTRLSFPSSSIKTIFPFQMLHLDLGKIDGNNPTF